MTLTEIAVGIAIAVGLAGVIVPILPGLLLVLAAIVVWATETGGTTAWVVCAIATGFVAIGSIIKYTIPGRRLKSSGVPNTTLLFGAAVGFAGFFVVPVIGLFLGFVLGVYLAERHRVGAHDAWPATKSALRAVAVSILIELVAGMLAAATWVVGVLLTPS